MRLLSFLTEIERAIRLEANAAEGEMWGSVRMVNFQTGLARLTLTACEADGGLPEGTVLVQRFALANGSFCLKASIAWRGSETSPVLSVYETPLLNWKLEANRIASAWLAGPPAEAAVATVGQSHEEERIAIAS